MDSNFNWCCSLWFSNGCFIYFTIVVVIQENEVSQMIDIKSRKVERMTKAKHAITGVLAFVGLMAIVYVLYLLVFNFPKLAVLFI